VAAGLDGLKDMQQQVRLIGSGEGTRTLLFDLQEGRVVYAKVEVKLTFNTNYETLLPLLPQLTSLPGVKIEAAPTGGVPTAGAPSGAPMPGAPGVAGMPSAPLPGRPMLGGPSAMGGISGEEAGFPAGAPYAGMPYGSAPTGPGAPFATQQPVFRNVPARLVYTYTLENTLDASGRLDRLLSGLVGR
ncbi:MAG: hypothetical protein SLRJCFUN_000572, partial [Candidatus Fervidibacter sp.]